MKFAALLNTFRNDESGAVTVDWVVLTAAIVGLGLVVMTQVGGAIRGASTTIATDIGTATNAARGVNGNGGGGSGGSGN